MSPNVHVHVHVHLHVADLARSVAFYEAFLGAPPVKRKQRYAKFLASFAPLNLALSQHATRPQDEATLSHLGLQLSSSAAVLAQLERVKAAGLATREELDVTCCFAKQDKFWVRDPDGVEWEVYYLKEDVEEDVEHDSRATQASSGTDPACCSDPPPMWIARIGPTGRR